MRISRGPFGRGWVGDAAMDSTRARARASTRLPPPTCRQRRALCSFRTSPHAPAATRHTAPQFDLPTRTGPAAAAPHQQKQKQATQYPNLYAAITADPRLKSMVSERVARAFFAGHALAACSNQTPTTSHPHNTRHATHQHNTQLQHHHHHHTVQLCHRRDQGGAAEPQARGLHALRADRRRCARRRRLPLCVLRAVFVLWRGGGKNSQQHLIISPTNPTPAPPSTT